MPEELQRRETRLKRIGEAKQALEQRAREQAEAEGKPAEEAQPEGKAQYNFTDPEVLRAANSVAVPLRL